MTIARSFSAERINAIANHPDVAPWVRGPLKGTLDLSPLIEDRRNVLLMAEHGGMLFHFQQPALYEVHTLMLPEGRGAGTIIMARAALDFMFRETDAVDIITRCPKGNLAAKALVRIVGLQFQFTKPDGWFDGDGQPIPADIYNMTRTRWSHLSVK